MNETQQSKESKGSRRRMLSLLVVVLAAEELFTWLVADLDSGFTRLPAAQRSSWPLFALPIPSAGLSISLTAG
jgi:hypothetical protein